MLTGVFTCQAMKLNFFPENCYFSIALTGKVPVSNKKLQPFILILSDLDRCFTCQCFKFYVFSYTLTGKVPVSNKKLQPVILTLTGTLPVSA